MVVAFNDAAYQTVEHLATQTLPVCLPWQVVLNSSAHAMRYLFFA